MQVTGSRALVQPGDFSGLIIQVEEKGLRIDEIEFQLFAQYLELAFILDITGDPVNGFEAGLEVLFHGPWFWVNLNS